MSGYWPQPPYNEHKQEVGFCSGFEAVCDPRCTVRVRRVIRVCVHGGQATVDSVRSVSHRCINLPRVLTVEEKLCDCVIFFRGNMALIGRGGREKYTGGTRRGLALRVAVSRVVGTSEEDS